MRCPRCGFEGEPVAGGCARCGYGRVGLPSGVLSAVGQNRAQVAHQYSLQPSPMLRNTLVRGNVLRQGRFRLIEPLPLPENQQGQGAAWLAVDTQSSQRRVILREVLFPAGFSSDKEQAVRSIAGRLADLAQHPGFPGVIDIFSEQGSYYIVLQYPDGESLGTLLKRQGGALPERMVAEFGRQLCEMLAHLARQRPPLVHGSIDPETIIVSPDKKRVSLIHLPLFPPEAQPPGQANAPSGYLSPEQTRGIVDPSVDLYAVAATLHHAVTGYDPRERLAFFHPPARRLNPAVTPGMESILSQALRLSSAQRYTRPIDMLKDLSGLVASYPPTSEETLHPATNPLLLDSTSMRKRSRNRSLLSVGILAGVSLIILISFLVAYFRPFSLNTAGDNLAQDATVTAQEQIALTSELALEARTFQKEGIGISDGRFAFDIYAGRNDVSLKQQAAQAIQHGDLSTAVNLLTQATTADPTDAEAQIYNEDLHILQAGASYVTVVLGIALDSSATAYLRARANLQGAYLAQHEINTSNTLAHLKLRILIDNSGGNNDNVATVAQFIANRVAKAGNPDHIIAVVGWPFSSQTIDARDIIAAVHLPLVSETASSVKLSGSSPYFFRVNPPDDAQGRALGTVAVDPRQFHARIALVMRDPHDPYSVSLANAFTASVESLKATAINSPSDYFSEGITTQAGYQNVINDALKSNADIIFMAGFDTDAVRLAHALGDASRANPTSTYLANLKILGGDGLDTGLILGQGNGPDAAIAKDFPQDMRRLNFSAFAHPDEWSFLHLPQNQEPVFFHDWSSTYQGPTIANAAPDPGNDAILTYDATRVIINAAALVHGSLTGQAVRDTLASLGKGSVPAFKGVSGRIFFDAQGNPVDKAVVVLDVVPTDVNNPNSPNEIKLLQVAGSFS